MSYIKLLGILFPFLLIVKSFEFFGGEYFRIYDRPLLIFLFALIILCNLAEWLFNGKIFVFSYENKNMIFLWGRLIFLGIFVISSFIWYRNEVDIIGYLMHLVVFLFFIVPIDYILHDEILTKLSK